MCASNAAVTAIAMFAANDEPAPGKEPSTSIAERTGRLSNEIHAFLKDIGPEKTLARSPTLFFPMEPRKKTSFRIHRETWHPWHDRLFWGYKHRFEGKILARISLTHQVSEWHNRVVTGQRKKMEECPMVGVYDERRKATSPLHSRKRRNAVNS